MSALFLSEHIRDLRKTVILSLLALITGFLLSLPLAEPFVNLLKQAASTGVQKERILTEKTINNRTAPLTLKPPKESYDLVLSEGVLHTSQGYILAPGAHIGYKVQESLPNFVLLGPIQGFSVLMKCALFLGSALSAPFWLLALWRFIAPGLEKQEKHILIPFFSTMLFFFMGGAFLGYTFILPPAITYLENVSSGIGTQMWSLPEYLEFCLFILFSSGIALEIFFFLLLLVHFNILTHSKLSSARRGVILGCFILGALLTPPDIATQFMMAIPLWILFEVSVLYAYFKSK